ncbi:hypothetical protein J6O48_09910 [bacterium]|nr:hypothetical protein [bacterium]
MDNNNVQAGLANINAKADIQTEIKGELKVADNIHNQIGGTTNIYGLTFAETKDLFQILFKQNFPKLKEEAMKICEQRIQSFEEQFFYKITDKLNESEMKKFADPDIQNDCNEIIKTVAKKNNPIINSLLIEILTTKIKDDDELQNITCSEAIKVADKLTETQLKIIMLSMYIVWLTHYTDNIDALEIEAKLFLDKINIKHIEPIDVEHLSYTGCINKLQYRNNFNAIFKAKYSNIERLQYLSNFSNYPSIQKLEDLWENEGIKYIELTSVGKVMAINYYEMLFPMKLNDKEKVFQRNNIED